jgi:hypothetical protein
VQCNNGSLIDKMVLHATLLCATTRDINPVGSILFWRIQELLTLMTTTLRDGAKNCNWHDG